MVNPKKPLMPRIASFIVLVAILLLIGGLFFQVIAGFLLPLFLALVLVVIFRPLYLRITERLRGRNRIAAAITTLAVLLVVLLPFSLLVTLAVFEAVSVVSDLGQDRFGPRLQELRTRFDLAIPEPVRKLDEQASRLNGRTQLKDPHAAVQSFERDLKALADQLLPDRDAAPAEDRPVSSAESQLRTALARFEGQMVVLSRLEGQSGQLDEELLQLHDLYFNEVRLRLVELIVESRAHAWLIVQANPSRMRFEEMRRQLLDGISAGSVGGVAVSTGKSVGAFLFATIFGLIVMTVSVYYFLADGPAMVTTLMRLSPLDPQYVDQLLTEFERVSRAVVMATLLSALAQGILAGMGYYFADVGSVFLLTVATMFLAMVPFFGATAVWLPCSLWLVFYEQRLFAGVALAIYGALIVSTIDNVIKPLILHGQSKLHPLLALLSVLGGVRALGPIGVFVGPMAVAFLQAVLNMIRTELNVLGGQAAPVAAATGQTIVDTGSAPRAATEGKT